LNPFLQSKQEILNTALMMSGDCEPLQKHLRQTKKSRDKIIDDVMMGGSLYISGTDQRFQRQAQTEISYLMRAFTCVTKEGDLALFLDSIEMGDPEFRYLNHWRGEKDTELSIDIDNRIHQVYSAIGAAMYLADFLDISDVIPRDFELTELATNLGVPSKRVFNKIDFEEPTYWKIGLHSRKSKTGVYTHSLYRGVENGKGNQLRHQVLERFAYGSSQLMIDRIKGLSNEIIATNKGRNRNLSPRTSYKIDALLGYCDLLKAYPRADPHEIASVPVMLHSVHNTVKFNKSEARKFGPYLL